MATVVGVGTVFYSGQRCAGGLHVRYSRNHTVVRETPKFWIDDVGCWWHKATGRCSPHQPTDFRMCDPETARALVDDPNARSH